MAASAFRCALLRHLPNHGHFCADALPLVRLGTGRYGLERLLPGKGPSSDTSYQTCTSFTMAYVTQTTPNETARFAISPKCKSYSFCPSFGALLFLPRFT